jgi:hypothetical protein
MAKIIKFPYVASPAEKMSNTKERKLWRVVCSGLIKSVWLFTALIWPFFKWIIAFDVVFQFIRMIYYWDTPGVYAGWTFLMHFTVLIILILFISYDFDKK